MHEPRGRGQRDWRAVERKVSRDAEFDLDDAPRTRRATATLVLTSVGTLCMVAAIFGVSAVNGFLATHPESTEGGLMFAILAVFFLAGTVALVAAAILWLVEHLGGHFGEPGEGD